MKTITLFTAVHLLLSTCFLTAQSKLTKEYYDNKVLGAQGYRTADGKNEGAWDYYYQSGVLQAKVNFQNGLRHGQYEEFYDNGLLMTKGLFANDKKEGTWEDYYDSGVKKATEFYRAGDFVGENTYYDQSGKIAEKRYWDSKPGNLMIKGYYPNGQLKKQEFYESAKEAGKWTGYYDTGVIMYIKDYDDNGSEKGYDSQGRLKYNYIIRSIGGAERTQYYETGEKEFELSYIDERKDGDFLFTNYHRNGKISAMGTFKNGTLHGILKEYDEQGKLISTETYENGVLVE